MKKYALLLLLMTLLSMPGLTQERFGNALNVGLGVGYYGYLGHSIPVLHLNYELNMAKNFTLAPFISFLTYRNDFYYDNNGTYYAYKGTVIPIGLKGTYYFDDLLTASSKWDFYLAGSLGFAIANSTWEAGYTGDRDVYRGPRSLFLDIHIGTEYHFNNRIGAFLDLSSGVSTIGLAIH